MSLRHWTINRASDQVAIAQLRQWRRFVALRRSSVAAEAQEFRSEAALLRLEIIDVHTEIAKTMVDVGAYSRLIRETLEN